MKTDPTTIAGMVAGAALAVAALSGLPKSDTRNLDAKILHRISDYPVALTQRVLTQIAPPANPSRS